MDCRDKLRFKNKAEADEHILYYAHLKVVEQEGLRAYECKRHNCWHMGHPQSYENNPVARIHNLLDRLNDE